MLGQALMRSEVPDHRDRLRTGASIGFLALPEIDEAVID